MSANNPASSSSAASKSKSKAKAKAKPRAWNKFPTLKLSAITGLERLRQSGQRILKEILNECDHPICCVLDPDLTRPLNLVTEGPQIFKDNGVRIFDELTPALDLKTKIDDKRKKNVVIKSILCLLKPTVENAVLLAKHVKRHANEDWTFVVYFMPRTTVMCQQQLQLEGIYNQILIGEYPVDLIPFDGDVLSMELNNCLRDCCLHNDNTSLSFVARAVMNLQSFYGTIAHVKAKGKLASIVLDMVKQMNAQVAEEKAKDDGGDGRGGSGDGANASRGGADVSEIDTLVLVDRTVDWISPLVTPLTYEALIDEMLTISAGVVYLPDEEDEAEEKAKAEAQGQSRPSYIRLNDTDDLYRDLRDFNITAVGMGLTRVSRETTELYNSRPDAGGSLTSIQDFVKKIPELQDKFDALQHHIRITELVQNGKTGTNSRDFRDRWQLERSMMLEDCKEDVLEEHIHRREPLAKVLRLLCLQSLFMNGFREKQFNALRQAIVEMYGYEHIVTLHNLERLRLFTKRGQSNLEWSRLKREMKLVCEGIRSDDPDDIAYVTSGYAPISGRLVERAVQNDWESAVLRKLPGGPPRTYDYKPETRSASGARNLNQHISVGQDGLSRRKVMLVFFIGGVTYMEISALRFIGRTSPYDIVVATTKLVNGTTLIDELIEVSSLEQ